MTRKELNENPQSLLVYKRLCEILGIDFEKYKKGIKCLKSEKMEDKLNRKLEETEDDVEIYSIQYELDKYEMFQIMVENEFFLHVLLNKNKYKTIKKSVFKCYPNGYQDLYDVFYIVTAESVRGSKEEDCLFVINDSYTSYDYIKNNIECVRHYVEQVDMKEDE